MTIPVSRQHIVGGAVGAWVGVCVTLVAAFEGYSKYPYVDRVGTGHPVTWCYGATGADGQAIPPMNKAFSEGECKALLGVSLQKYDDEIKKCIHVSMTADVEAAMVSEAYNLGPGTVCRYVAPLLNKGNVKGACTVLRGFVHGDGQVLPGLVRRRLAEQNLCLKGT